MSKKEIQIFNSLKFIIAFGNMEHLAVQALHLFSTNAAAIGWTIE